MAYLFREGQAAKVGTQFLYSKTSSHLVAAVLAAALRRAGGDHPGSVVDYVRCRRQRGRGLGVDEQVEAVPLVQSLFVTPHWDGPLRE